MKKAVVVGSGISGLSIARMLSPIYEVSILEKAPVIGGMIKCERIDGNLFHRVGGHVFNSRNQAVLDWFWQHFDRDRDFLKAKRNAKILLNDTVIGYPIENFLYQLPAEQVKAIVTELLAIIKQKEKQVNEYSNFEAFLKGNFGPTLYDLYFGPYNSKIWNTDISKVPLEWLDGKLPMPNITDTILSNIIKQEESTMVHASFYYAKENGSQFIVDTLAKGLSIHVSEPLVSVAVNNGSLLVNDHIESNVLVYCGDVRKLSSIIHIEDNALKESLEAVTGLASNGTSNVLCETDDTAISWLYLPEDKFKAHRIIYTGNFSDTNNHETSRKTCVVEFSGKHDEATMIQELQQLPGNLKALAFNYEPNSYIIQHADTREKIAKAKEQLARYHIYLLGRFAEWEYYNMDKCIESAMELSNQLLK